ncbi:TspO/MBR family protein [Oceanirhabdus sp. W0125-5]|uniref:TspO/MBR family protein n=1 Tax=Oceanirhabdus sp. W0125-5 TaxID=2999116 RepID=UPI0022F2F819|nr:TspO/MBR family protein [Oceanirhabdus sp. W0125-5]WBW96159.1 tryptophan-rich sensory protein [Oceanirhabdus sp. W0125-5]
MSKVKLKIPKFNGERLFYFLLSFIITFGAAIISSIWAKNTKGTYELLKKPYFAPPPIVFPIVWNILFVLMAYALYRVWRDIKKKPENRRAIKLYFIQLLLNFLWSPIFFGLNLRFIAFIVLIFLWIFIALTLKEFYKRDKLAGILLIPYLLWVTFAGVLNFSIWFLNA